MRYTEGKGRNEKAWPKRIVLILSLCVLAACAVYLGKYFYESCRAANDIEEIRELVDEGGGGDAPKEEAQPEPEAEPEEPQQERYAENGMLLGYYNAYRKNSDMAGWVSIPGTKIDYPVMHKAGDNEFYLHRNFDKEYQYSGLPFIDGDCDLSLPSDNIIIYAHNMRDGSMFAHLLDYEDRDFFEAHPKVKFDTNYKRGEYAVFAVFSTKVGAPDEFKYYSKTMFKDKNDFEEYVKEAKERSFYDTGVDVSYGDALLTLSTCSYSRSNERTVVMAKKLF